MLPTLYITFSTTTGGLHPACVRQALVEYKVFSDYSHV